MNAIFIGVMIGITIGAAVVELLIIATLLALRAWESRCRF